MNVMQGYSMYRHPLFIVCFIKRCFTTALFSPFPLLLSFCIFCKNTLDINYLNKNIANRPYTKFLGLMVDANLTWNNHIDQLISTLNSACYAIRAVNAMSSSKGLRMLYFSYIHSTSIISYGIIFWGNTPHSIKTFRI